MLPNGRYAFFQIFFTIGRKMVKEPVLPASKAIAYGGS